MDYKTNIENQKIFELGSDLAASEMKEDRFHNQAIFSVSIIGILAALAFLQYLFFPSIPSIFLACHAVVSFFSSTFAISFWTKQFAQKAKIKELNLRAIQFGKVEYIREVFKVRDKVLNGYVEVETVPIVKPQPSRPKAEPKPEIKREPEKPKAIVKVNAKVLKSRQGRSINISA